MFATEQVIASSHAMMQETTNPDMQLDEVEVQKGFLQIAQGLEFLHDAKLIHTNLTSNAVVINAKGDWKPVSYTHLTLPTILRV